jgi:predicted LPLAT superfamily acyltransferase
MRRRFDGDLSGRQRPAWATRPERGHAFALRCGVRLALAVGRPVAWWLLHGVSLYFLLASAADRAASRQYLRRALDREPGWSDLFRHFHSFATTILDRVYLLNGQYGRYEVRSHGEEIVAGMLARGQGCLLVGAHFGSFEIVRFLGHAARAPRVTLVMYEQGTKNLNAALNAINPNLAMRVIALGKIDSMLQLEHALADGEFVGVLADRAIEGESTEFFPFLGAPARLPAGPFRIAAILKCPVVLMFGIYRGGSRYDIHFETLADMSGLSRADRERVIGETMRRYVERLEHYCRLAPYNWFNFYDYWS